MNVTSLSLVCACVCSIGLCFGDGERTVTLSPEADAFLQRGGSQSTTCYGKDNWLSAGEQRESIIRFDVSGVSDISSARIRLRCNQHAAGDETFVVFRTVRDFDWDESSVTRANMVHAIPYLSTRSAWIAESDPDYAGIAAVTEAGSWVEADVTEAVRKAARTNGKVTFHMFSPCGDRNWVGTGGPDCFDSREASDATVRPQLVVTCTGTGSARTWTDYDITEMHFAASDAVWMNNGNVISGSSANELLANPGVRSFLLKFDTGTYSAGSVERAVLRLVGDGASNAASTNWDLLIEDAGDWDGATIQSDGLHSEILSRTRIPGVLPENGLNFTSFSHAKYVTNELDVTELVRQGSKFASGCLTFQALSGGDYIICGGRVHSDAALHPELEIQFREATMSVKRDEVGVKVSWKAVGGAQAYHVERAADPDGEWTRVVSGVTATSAYDGLYPGAFAWWYRVVTVDADGNEIVGQPLLFNEKPVWETREALQNGRPFSRTPDAPAYTGVQMQCGNPGNDVALVYLMFDPTGLDDVPTARFRFRGCEGNHSGEMRILGSVTDVWDPASVTWKRGVEGFTHLNPVPDSKMEHELARIGYDLSPTNQAPYYEVEVTELVREAARQKRYLTILMTGSHGDAWQFFNTQEQGVGADNRPMLVYPAVTGFGRLTATGDFTGEMPTAKLVWNPGPVGTTYCVTREVQRVEDERVLAERLTEPSFIDEDARRETSVYRVTATFPGGTTASVTVTNSLYVVADLPCVADTFVHLKTPDTAYGTSTFILLKDGGSGDTTREGLMRFDLSTVPSGLSRVYLQLQPLSKTDFAEGEWLYVRGIEEGAEWKDWTDGTAPGWNTAFPGRQRAADPAVEGFCGRIAASEMRIGEPFKLDVTAAVLQAIAAGRTSCTLHLYLDDPDKNANCEFYSRETSAMVGYRAKLLCVKRNWRGPGMMIILR